MSELEEFFTKTREDHKEELRDFEELKTLLDSIHGKKKMSHVRHEAISNI